MLMFSLFWNIDPGLAQNDLPVEDVKKMSIEELMNLEVTTVSRQPERLNEVASAIQVITQEDIRRSAATSLPEVLRLVANLQVAQLNSSSHIISSRGFNATFSNKLLVIIDGRTVYSPLFAGVFWDAQQVVLEDIEQIEVISGPGGTIWGANAVNGVINIITKNAKDTQGLLLAGSAGTFLKSAATARYGGQMGKNMAYRVFAQHVRRAPTHLPNGDEAMDNFGIANAGFRLDWTPSTESTLTLKGNAYDGSTETATSPSTLDGQNLLARYSRTLSESSGWVVQAYFDRTWRRDIPSTLSDELKTYDLEFEHYFNLKEKHQFIWGGGYRAMENHTINSTEFVAILPNRRDMHLFSFFVQDEIKLNPNFFWTVGTKIEHNSFSGIEIQPSTRMAWTPGHNKAVWAAVSRAVRSPSRIDVDSYIPAFPVGPEAPSVAGGPNFVSEKVIAYELGYRLQPESNLTVSLATFYNRYDDLYSVEPLPGTLTYQIQNGTEGTSWGVELSGTWQVIQNWRLRGGYTYLNMDLRNKPGRVYDFSDLANDAEHQGMVHSMMNLPGGFQFDVSLRYLSDLPTTHTPDYFTFDARLAWVYKQWGEISLVGQHLGQDRHYEFINQIPRSVYGKVLCRF